MRLSYDFDDITYRVSSKTSLILYIKVISVFFKDGVLVLTICFPIFWLLQI